MRRALLIALLLISLIGADYRSLKRRMRWLAVALGRTALRLASVPYEPKDGTAVIFAPHQDDESLGCGALVARKRNEGLPVHVVFITDGSASHPGHPTLSPENIATIRAAEAREALRLLGVESNAIHCLQAPDGALPQLSQDVKNDLVDRITRLLEEIEPDEIFLPCSPDGSSEHEAAFQIVIEAAGRTTDRNCEIWQYPVWSWWNPLLLARHIAVFGLCRSQRAEDFQAIKIRALQQYRSQMEPLPPQMTPSLPPELVRVFQTDHEFFFRFHLPKKTS
jgi:LmbE family N-acetylglucosaminyl deacetylase